MGLLNVAGKNLITVPVRVLNRAKKRQEKIRIREIEDQHSKYYRGDRKLPPLIMCRRPELNHYLGQVYPPFKRLPMATEHWSGRRSNGDFFAFLPYRGASATNWSKYETNKLIRQRR